MEFDDVDDFLAENSLNMDHDQRDEVEPLNDEAALDAVIKQADGGDETEDGKKRRRGPTKPRPKLTEQNLTGPKGLFALRKLMQKVTIDPKSDPYENLAKVMQQTEYWAHSLFPKMDFDDFLDRVYTLSKKRPVRVYMTKLRHGLPLHEDERDNSDVEADSRPQEGYELDLDPITGKKVPLPLSNRLNDSFDDNDNDFDIFDDERFPPPTSLPSTNPIRQVKSQTVIPAFGDDDDDDLLFGDNDNVTASPPQQKPASADLSGPQRYVIDSDDDESRFHEIQGSRPQSRKRKYVLDSDDEDPPSKAMPEKELDSTKPSFVIDSDDENESEAPNTSTKKSKKVAIIESDDEDENNDKVDAKSGENEVTADDALDLIFG